MAKDTIPKVNTRKSFWTRYKDIIAIFIFTRISIYAVSLSAYRFIQIEIDAANGLWLGITPSSDTFLKIWERWDAIYYR
jgi:hypothetical protein